MGFINKSSKKTSDGYYHIKDLIEIVPDARYYMVYSLRSNGKSYSALEYILENYLKGKGQGAIIRRYDLDFKNRRGGSMFRPLVEGGLISKLSHMVYNGVEYKAGEFYLIHKDDDGVIDKRSTEPFCFGFSLTGGEHDKSTGYPNVTTIVLDEFIARDGYLADEFVLFMNQISTIIRRRDNVKIFMLGNTINQYNPYFEEMGITHAREQKPGSVDVYEYGESGLKVAVEYAEKPVTEYNSDVYFAFDNPKLHMITDGDWELNIYPHSPMKIKPKDIKFRFYIIFKEHTIEGDIVMCGHNNFIFCHKKTTEIKDPEKFLIFDLEHKPEYNYGRKLRSPANKIQQRIGWYFKADKVFYQDNVTGEIVRNYIEWSEMK